jgi:hypothetical protein
MRTVFRLVARAVAAFLAFVLAASSACNISPDLSMSGQPCGSLACEKSGVLVTATLAATRAELIALEVEVCKNDACVRSQPTAAADGSFACDAFGPIATTCRMTPLEPGPTSRLVLTLPGRDSDFVDGDHYVIRVGRPSAAPLFTVDRIVSPYETTRPNGPLCEPRCRFVELSI